MNLQNLIQALYGEFAFTGLYSFEFVSKKGNTITEFFLMQPPKRKNVDEPSRSSIVPTLASNYVLDAGNGIKTINLSGDLYFPHIGSPDNPVAKDVSGLANQISGMSEWFKLRWMLVRYKDYTMSRKARMTIPTDILGLSPEVEALYAHASKKVKDKIGALSDEIKVIFHDYDMDDHWYCRVSNLNSSQDDSKHIVISYNITLECYEPAANKRAIAEAAAKLTAEAEAIAAAQQLAKEADALSGFSGLQGLDFVNNPIGNI